MTSLPQLRDAARRLRDLADRVLHTPRRRAFLARLEHRPVRSVLVVCHGNICRSPFSERLLHTQFPAGGPAELSVESAGLIGPDRPSPPEAVRAARAWGVDLVPHRSRLITPGLVAAADLVVVMDRRQQQEVCARFGRAKTDVRLLGDLDPAPLTTRDIIDPVDRPSEVFDACYERIHRCIVTLAAGTQVPNARTRHAAS